MYILILLIEIIEIQILSYTLTKNFMEVQGYMLNPFEIIFLNMYLSTVYITRRKTYIFDCSLQLNFSRKRHFATKILLVT